MTRTGANNSPSFRVVATDSRSPRDGRYLENLGWYDPKKVGVNFELHMDRIDHWEGKGAQVSDTVRSLIRRAKRAAK
jgi:small subunit ribosomal protein S16